MSGLVDKNFPSRLSLDRIDLGYIAAPNQWDQELGIIRLSDKMVQCFAELQHYLLAKTEDVAPRGVLNSARYCIQNTGLPKEDFSACYLDIYQRSKGVFEERFFSAKEAYHEIEYRNQHELPPIQDRIAGLVETVEARNAHIAQIFEENPPENPPLIDELLVQTRADWLGWTVERIHADNGILYLVSVIIQTFSRSFFCEVQFQRALRSLQGLSAADLARRCILFVNHRNRELRRLTRRLEGNERYTPVLNQLREYAARCQVALAEDNRLLDEARQALREEREHLGQLEGEQETALATLNRAKSLLAGFVEEIRLILKNHQDRPEALRALWEDREFSGSIRYSMYLRHKDRGFPILRDVALLTPREKLRFVASQRARLLDDPGMVRGFDRSGSYFLLFRLNPRQIGMASEDREVYELYREDMNRGEYTKTVFTEEQVNEFGQQRDYGRGARRGVDDEYKVREDVPGQRW